VPNARKHRRVLGENIKIHRQKAGLTQEKLAELADLHTNFVGDIERGEENVALDALVRLASSLRVKVADLVQGI
jgi:transcriptional regulator with XRE-family HTH domain